MKVDGPVLSAAERWRAGPYYRRRQTLSAMKARQSAKIHEIADALVSAGFVALDEQAKALGLGRSTTWTVLKSSYKNSGISATIINRILSSPQLPPAVRAKVIEYVEEKLAGLYGHGQVRRRRYIALLNPALTERDHLNNVAPLQPDVEIEEVVVELAEK
jgi:hypothetical protein